MKNKIKPIGIVVIWSIWAILAPNNLLSQKNRNMSAPKPTKKDVVLEYKVGNEVKDTRIDSYYWMRLTDEQKEAAQPDDQTQEVLDYLHAENAYTKSVMAPTEALQDKLFAEMKGRVKETDQSVPTKDNGYWYYTRFEQGKDYAFYCRKKESMELGLEEVLIDGPALAEGKSYWALGGMTISDDNQWMAYGVDEISRRVYQVYFKNLNTGEVIADKLEGTTGRATWSADNKTVFYSREIRKLCGSFKYGDTSLVQRSLKMFWFLKRRMRRIPVLYLKPKVSNTSSSEVVKPCQRNTGFWRPIIQRVILESFTPERRIWNTQ